MMNGGRGHGSRQSGGRFGGRGRGNFNGRARVRGGGGVNEKFINGVEIITPNIFFTK